MSFRLFTSRLFRHGRFLIQHYCRRDIHTTKIFDQQKPRNAQLKAGSLITNQQSRTPGFLRFGQHARKLFVDNVLNRVTTPYSAELRLQATKKFLYGDSAPFFALVGVSLASGTGLLTKDDELEGVCYEIRQAVSQFQSSLGEKELNRNFDDEFGLEKLDIGPPIAKGCSAVVYAAKLKDEMAAERAVSPLEVPDHVDPEQPLDVDLLSPLPSFSRFVHNFGGSADNINERASPLLGRFGPVVGGRTRSISASSYESTDGRTVRFGDATVASPVSVGSPEGWTSLESIAEDVPASMEYPLALKMLFNYDIQSNAMSILRAMYKETVPALRRNLDEATEWERMLMDETIALPAHPNIVAIFGVFCAQIPRLRDASRLYPMALPPRLNPQGYGRNMSLFLLMKRYDCSLKDFLAADREFDMRTKVLLFAQLLEAVAHLNRHGVAHRDLKSDNILIETSEDSAPVLVLSDFGCCLADKNRGLQIPYTSPEIDKGGNTALMAPEIITKAAGVFAVLNYAKADLWACGTIGYEIFAGYNPFYGDEGSALKNFSYKDSDLPQLPDDVPPLVRKLVENILQRNPRKRLSSDVAANVIQLHLWAPSAWIRGSDKPTSNEILQWLLSLTTKTLCEGRLNVDADYRKAGRRTYTEYLLISNFLVRARLSRIRQALDWILAETRLDAA